MGRSKILSVFLGVAFLSACGDNGVAPEKAAPPPAYEPDPLPVINFCELAAGGGTLPIQAGTTMMEPVMSLPDMTDVDALIALLGALELDMTFMPFQLNLTITEFTMDGITVSGSVGIRPMDRTADVALQLESPDLTAAIDANLAQEEGEDSVTTRINGSGDLSSPELSTPLTITEVGIVTGDCLPSSGSLGLEFEGLPATIWFLPTTPDDGVARVDLGSFGETTAILPCNGTCDTKSQEITE